MPWIKAGNKRELYKLNSNGNRVARLYANNGYAVIWFIKKQY